MQPPTGRLAQLMKLLEREPDDTFLLYGIALEYKKAADFPTALNYLKRVIEKDALNSAAYHQAGQVHEQTGDLPSARQAYRDGITAAQKSGNQHAMEEMQGALSIIDH